MMDVLISLVVRILFQCLHISNHHFVYFVYICQLYLNNAEEKKPPFRGFFFSHNYQTSAKPLSPWFLICFLLQAPLLRASFPFLDLTSVREKMTHIVRFKLDVKTLSWEDNAGRCWAKLPYFTDLPYRWGLTPPFKVHLGFEDSWV